jgi:hypothetical protein
MSTYKATSWGRTRRPKHLREQIPPAKQTATTVTGVVALSAGLVSTDAGKNGYSTENQRYLHVFVDDTGNSGSPGTKNVVIYAYCYAFGEWAPLMLPLGNATFTKATATAGASGAAQHYIFEISGVDRVAFYTESGDAADIPHQIRAACSTF